MSEVSEGVRGLSQLVTRKGVAVLLAISTKSVDRLVQRGKLHPVRLSARLIRFSLSEVNRYLEELANEHRVQA
jgi:excisionase family DNA binding protein